MHNVWSLQELDKLTAPGGALNEAVKARDEGLVRYISISGHTNPQVQIEALERFPFDSVLCALSVLDHFIFSFAEEFLPIAKTKGVAVIGMKVLGLGALAHVYDSALRYTMGLPVCTVIVGMESMDQLKKNIEVAESYKSLSDEERLQLFKVILPLVNPKTLPWKSEEWGKETNWSKR